MALINDDVTEVVIGVMLRQETCRILIGIHAQSLISSNQNSCILLGLPG